MKAVFENLEQLIENNRNSSANRIEALKTLAKLMLYEVESIEDFGPSASYLSPSSTTNLADRVQRYEASLICNALVSANGNQRKAAAILGVKATTLYAKVKRYGIDFLHLSGQFAENEAI